MDSDLKYTKSAIDLYKQTHAEKVHQEATEILAKKRQLIAELNRRIDIAERQCSRLRAEVEVKYKLVSDESISMQEEEDVQELEKTRVEHSRTIERLVQMHNEQIDSIHSEFEKKLKDAESWNIEHLKTIRVEKEARVEELRRDIEELDQMAAAAFLASTKKKDLYIQDVEVNAHNNKRKIAILERKLSDLTGDSKNELREVRSKIGECLSTVELRQDDYRKDIESYNHEIDERNLKYKQHIDSLEIQFNNEKARLLHAAKSEDLKMDSLTKMLEQLIKTHEHQMSMTKMDIDRMRSSLISAKTRAEALTQSQSQSLPNLTVSQTSKDCRQIEQELALVEREISELRNENMLLRDDVDRQSMEIRRPPRSLIF